MIHKIWPLKIIEPFSGHGLSPICNRLPNGQRSPGIKKEIVGVPFKTERGCV